MNDEEVVACFVFRSVLLREQPRKRACFCPQGIVGLAEA